VQQAGACYVTCRWKKRSPKLKYSSISRNVWCRVV
jgi:hypothetical protein